MLSSHAIHHMWSSLPHMHTHQPRHSLSLSASADREWANGLQKSLSWDPSTPRHSHTYAQLKETVKFTLCKSKLTLILTGWSWHLGDTHQFHGLWKASACHQSAFAAVQVEIGFSFPFSWFSIFIGLWINEINKVPFSAVWFNSLNDPLLHLWWTCDSLDLALGFIPDFCFWILFPLTWLKETTPPQCSAYDYIVVKGGYTRSY